MPQEWSDWSGLLRFVPRSLEGPTTEEELADLVRRAAVRGGTARVVGAGHSMPPLVETRDILVSLDSLRIPGSFDAEACRATLPAGMKLGEAGKSLFAAGLAMENLGDVDTQALAGAVGTGTHGSGKRFGNLSSQVVGLRMVTADGEVVECSSDRDPELFRAARVSLGALGIFTSVTLRVLPAYRLRRREWCVPTEVCLAQLDRLIAENRNFDFYWYPRRDEVKIRTLNPPEYEPGESTPAEGLVADEVAWSHEGIPRPQQLKYVEMEYAIPIEAGPACFREVRRRVIERHRKIVAWRILYRTVAADDGDLSPFQGRDSVTIALLQNVTLPYEEYFFDVEPIFLGHGGRPHWGKLHSLRANKLRTIYPMWDRFRAVRRRMDPDGRFLNAYLRELLEGS